MGQYRYQSHNLKTEQYQGVFCKFKYRDAYLIKSRQDEVTRVS